MKKILAEITVQNKKYPYSLEEKKKDVVFVMCKAANIAQDFLKEDIGNLIIDLPNLIVAEKEYDERHSNVIRFRISSTDKHKIEKRAAQEGYNSVSEYMRDLALK